MVSQNAVSKISARSLDLKIFVKDVCDRNGRKRPLVVKTWSTIKDVKDQIQKLLHIPQSSQRLYFSPLLMSVKELPNYRTLQDAGIYRSGETLLLDVAKTGIDDSTHGSSLTSLRSYSNDICVSPSMLESTPKNLRRTIQKARRGLSMGIKPELVLDGSGGTYFLHDARKAKVAVFKPADEEPYAENNPRGYVKQGVNDDMSLRSGIKPGEACLREVAAYLLDHGGFSAVPMTTLAEARHPAFHNNGKCLKVAEGGAALGTHSYSFASNIPHSEGIKKVGSCQEFARSECTMDDISPSKLSVEEVHKIAILDIRLMNADRNVANLLCRRRPDNSFELIPIDHGYCLRSVCDVCWFDWCWLDWPQLKEPLSKKSKEFINNLDIETDACLLQEQLSIGPEAINFLKTSTKLLKVGVQAGLSLYDIASLCCRQDNAGEIRSKLEIISSQAHELATSVIENGKWNHATASRALEGHIVTSPSKSNMSRSKSHVHFSAAMNKVEKSLSSIMLPKMTMTSGSSDSSSDVGDNELENDDCAEWAASIIDGVDIEKTLTPLTKRHRCQSFTSDASGTASSYSSSNGFWHVNPSMTETNDFDSVGSPFSGAVTPKLDIEDVPCLPIEFPCCAHVPHEDNNTKFKSLSITMPYIQLKPTVGRLVRSQSYSTISIKDLKDLNHRDSTLMRLNNTETEQYRVYFHKFIDLLIERITVSLTK